MLPPRRSDDFSAPAVSLRTHAEWRDKSLGKHANFVINFCQIVFDPQTPK
jgi:hypothetical protein